MNKIIVTVTPEGDFAATLEGRPETRTVDLNDKDAIYGLIIKHKDLFGIQIEMDKATRERAIAMWLP